MLSRSRLPIAFDHLPRALKGGLTRFTAALFVAFVMSPIAFAPRAFGGLILQPTGVITSTQIVVGTVDAIRNQSGLSAAYTSQVTNFDTYIASNPTTPSFSPVDNFLAFFGSTSSIVFDLGGTYSVESLALWNGGQSGLNGTSSGIRDFQLQASSTSSFSSFVSLGSFTATQAPSVGNVGAQVFTFSPTTAAFIRLNSLNTHGSNFTTLNEVAFEAAPITAVPEPSSLAMLAAAGTIGLARYRRRAKGK